MGPPPACLGSDGLETGRVTSCACGGRLCAPKSCRTHLLPSAPFFSLKSRQRRRVSLASWGGDPGLSAAVTQEGPAALEKEGRRTFIPW